MQKKTNRTKGQRTKSRARKKQRDRFVTNAVMLATAAILFVVAANIWGADSDNDVLPGKEQKENTLSTNEETNENYTDTQEVSKDNDTGVQEAPKASDISPDTAVRFEFIDVGQGDSALITTPNKEYILVDAGTSDSKRLMKHLESSGVDEIDYLILSHPHNDHIGGAEDVLKKYSVKCVIMPDVVTTTSVFERLYDALVLEKESAGCSIYSANPGDIYNIDNCVIKIIGPLECDEDDYNNCSACFTFTYGEFDAMFTGDAESKVERMLLAEGLVSECELYKVAHHGSNTSSSNSFIAKASPEVSVISCGKDNSYGHPSTEIVERLSDVGSQVYITAEKGTITVFTDGSGYSVLSER